MTNLQPSIDQFWLIKTNQIWKIYFFLILMFIAMMGFVAMIMVINGIWMPKSVSEFELAFSSITIGFGSLIWLSHSIKCPYCGYKPVGPMIKSSNMNTWFVNITKLEHCASCKR